MKDDKKDSGFNVILNSDKKIIITSSCPSLEKDSMLIYKPLSEYQNIDTVPCLGDVVLGEVTKLGQHTELEDTSGRIHQIHEGTTALFVIGNRYATGYYEGLVPCLLDNSGSLDLLARGGVVGKVTTKTSQVKEPTKIKILGHLIDYQDSDHSKVYNTKRNLLVKKQKDFEESLKHVELKNKQMKTILCIGSSMDSGKSTVASRIVWCLSRLGHSVMGSKITGTASLKDILNMSDSGADYVSDFTSLGYPSTYMISQDETLGIYKSLRYDVLSQGQSNYWVIEIADGILQRETKYLLNDKSFINTLDHIVYCSPDSLSCIGGLNELKNQYDITPSFLSGIITSYPLMQREVTDNYPESIAFFNNRSGSPEELIELLNKPVNKKHNVV